MKKIDTTQASSTARQPFYARSNRHLQESIAEGDDAVFKAMLSLYNMTYVANDMVVCYGVLNSGSSSGLGNPWNVSAGWVYYNGEFYEVPAVSGTFASGATVLVLTLTTSYQSGDPSLFSDGSLKNVHQIRTMVVSEAASGAGTKDYSALSRLPAYTENVAQQITLATQSTSSGTYVDLTGLTYTTPNDGITRRYKLTLKGVAELSAASGAGTVSCAGKFQIYNNTGAVSLDVCRLNSSIIIAAGTNDVYAYQAVNCQTIVTLAPNVLVKCQFLNDADGVTATDLKYLIEEI